MSKQLKLSVSLGLREKLEKDHVNLVADMVSKFKNAQGLFHGVRNTFVAADGHPDQPEQRKFTLVPSTVKEQLEWTKEHSRDVMNTVLSIEKTNASGPKGELIVDGKSWGFYTSLELLRLKNMIEARFRNLVQLIPIRTAGELWTKTSDPVYEGREVYETPVDKGHTKTTLKRITIVNDPHIEDAPTRPPVTQSIDTPVNTGEYTRQTFSGAITNRQRAEIEVRLNNVLKGIIAALEEANNTELITSDLGDKTLDYLFSNP